MWIPVTLFAAACQSARTAYQNTLSREAGFLHATMARSLYGLPLVSLYLAACWFIAGGTGPVDSSFLLAASVCAVAQILATYLMLRAFHSGSFALGTLLAKTEAVQAALLGILLLSLSLTVTAWVGVLLGVSGALIMSADWGKLRQIHRDRSLLYGLASGFFFALTSVSAAIASRTLHGHVSTNAALTLCYVLALQSVLLCGLQIIRQRDWLAPFRHAPGLSIKVGVLSSLGSIGWFTAFALANPALVKTLGQIEIIGTLYYSRVRFGERISRKQVVGGALILISVLMVALGH